MGFSLESSLDLFFLLVVFVTCCVEFYMVYFYFLFCFHNVTRTISKKSVMWFFVGCMVEVFLMCVMYIVFVGFLVDEIKVFVFRLICYYN